MPADVLTLFDLDNTLVPHDSEQLWVEFLVADGVLDPTEVTVKSRDLTERFNRGEAGPIEFTEFYLGLLTAFHADVLDHLRRRFIAEWVRDRITAAARRLVHQHQAAGDWTVVTSGVFRFLAEPQAAEFGIVDVIATEGEMLDGRFTGRVAGIANAREGKVERLREWLAGHGVRLDSFRDVWVYADSINDLPLLSHATRPVAVNADALLAITARHSGWPILSLA